MPKKKITKQELGAVFANPNMLLFSITFELNLAISALCNAKDNFNKYIEVITKKEKK